MLVSQDIKYIFVSFYSLILIILRKSLLLIQDILSIFITSDLQYEDMNVTKQGMPW